MQLDHLARRQQGVVTRAQALACGMTAASIRWRLTRDDWQVLHRGVYLTHSGSPDWRARARAALLRCGPGSVLTLGSAAYLWRLEQVPPARITVAVPHDRHPERVAGVLVVRRRHLEPAVVDGLPATHLTTTVLDLADRRGCTADTAVALAARACQMWSLDATALRRELESRARHRHRRHLRIAFEEIGRGAESLPETWFEGRVRRRHGLPEFERQAVESDRTRTDLKNRTYGLNIEIDGRIWHAGERFHLDRQRDRRAAARGELTVRVTPRELDRSPCAVAADLAQVLRQRGWDGVARGCSPTCCVADMRRPGPPAPPPHDIIGTARGRGRDNKRSR